MMKKITRCCLLIATLFSSVTMLHAEDVKVLVPGDEFHSVAELTGQDFAMMQGDNALYGSSAQNLAFSKYSDAFSASNSGYLFRLEPLANNAAASDAIKPYYLLRLITPAGAEYNIWGSPGYLNSQNATGWCSFILGLNGQFGQDLANGAVFDIQYVEGSGFTLRNLATGLYLNNAGTANHESPAYWTFCKLEESSMENPIPKPDRTATDAKVDCFTDFVTISDNATYDPETRNFTNRCGFIWSEGVDLSQYQYLVITAAQCRAAAGAGHVQLRDLNGMTVGGDDYGVSNMNMWMSLWNHHNCCLIDLEKLRQEHQFDIYHITELSIDGGTGFVLGNVYASNTAPLTFGPWSQGNEGSYRRQNLTAEKFGTICLPYQAAVAGAYIYEIAAKNRNEVELARVDGLMEAGKPYIFCTIENKIDDENQFKDEVAVNNVYFYQATAQTVSEPLENNGLVGTFVSTQVPANCYVLSDNVLMKTVAGDLPTAGENRAWLDPSLIVNTEGANVSVRISAGTTTAIEQPILQEPVSTENLTVFDISGRKVKKPSSGLYIVNGKKVLIK